MSAQPPAPERAPATAVPAQNAPAQNAPAQNAPAQNATAGDATSPAGEGADEGFPVPAGPHAGPRPTHQNPGIKARGKGGGSMVDTLAGMPRPALIGGAVAMLALLVGLVVFAVVPAFQSHQAKSQWSDTTVSLPASVGGLKRLKSRQITALVRTMAANGIPSSSVAVYGTLGKNAVILVAAKPAKPLTGDDQQVQRDAMERGFTTATKLGGFNLVKQDAGRLGGYLGCGRSSGSTVTVCLATDSGSVVGTITGPTAKDPAGLARSARAAAVHRKG